MSFILDALKKSENERQQQTGGEFSNVPSSSGESQSFRWLWILALLLIVNFIVLLGILMGPDKTTETGAPIEQTPTVPASATPASTPEPTFEERVEQARQNQPTPVAVEAEAEPDPGAAQPEGTLRPAAAPAGPRLMTIDELRLSGVLQIPELHIDIHVYADDPAERFVFINMTKHRESSQLAEGPVVTEITMEGVILEYQGSTFLLPRE